jgi:hypothetical protein
LDDVAFGLVPEAVAVDREPVTEQPVQTHLVAPLRYRRAT